ncbi:hypothetical protein [Tropicibacter naphthalenivorans]|uniref:PH domain-containing protein n=1 Tax=Tropicibacter naphthalenivorans TaxID=441103 RepID=A0A0P1G084_9RHOB|nr:hypothetical protein [Tropicibacter naphthalenivorans]CUH75062.1 hypothetical protein TRN7648_00237 [Tropicibacter naphthalenivorans]SMC47016.1 hypothetical protein SAMN04488093_101643 [Tropicibacter naphthalenivorans]
MTFTADKATYLRTHATMAALAMAAGMLILWIAGNPHIWTGAIGGLAAVVVRGWYLMDEELAHTWTREGDALHGPAGRVVPLDQIEKARAIGSAVQLITRAGDKHLIKFQPDPQAVIAQIDAARASAGSAP